MSRMFQYKAIPSTWLDINGRRLDCGPYMSGAIEAKELLIKLRMRKDHLKDLCKDGIAGIVNAGRISRIWVSGSEHGHPFLSSTNILQADLSSTSFIAKSVARQNRQLRIKKNWSLITRSGFIGRMAFARSEMDGMACSEDVLRVIPDEEKVKPGFLYVYLTSKFGVPLVASGSYGSIITHLEPHHLADLPVPRLGDIEVQSHDLVQRAADLLSTYQVGITQATELFFNSVGLSDITSNEWHSWGSDLGFATTVGVKSLRALNFNPRFNRLCERIKQGPWKPLHALCVPETLKRGARFSRVDADLEYAYRLVGQKELFWLRPEGRWIAKKSVSDGVLVEDGCVLVAAQGTLGESELYCRAEFATGKALGNAYSEHILRVLGDKNVIKRGALFAFMRSKTAFRMLRSISVGSKLQDHHYAMLPSLPVPYPPENIRTRCHQLIIEAYAAREKSIELEDQARTLVEEAIEEGAS